MSAPKLSGPRPEEINFDLSARQDYLTGFHKRKVQRTKAAQEAAEKRAKEERRIGRNKLREQRKQELQERVKMVDDYIKPPKPVLDDDHESESGSNEGSDTGSERDEDEPLEKVDHEAEYVDEDKYTSVVVEEVDVDRDGFVNAETPASGHEEAPRIISEPHSQRDGDAGEKSTRRKWTKERPRGTSSKPKIKRKKFRYESKAERKAERGKQRAKNSKQAQARRAK